MMFRRKLLLVFALTLFLSIAVVVLTVSWWTRTTFEKINEEQTAALVAQFHRNFDRRGQDVVRRVQAIASSEAATRMVLSQGRDTPDYGAYLNEAKSIADAQQLNFLEFVDGQGTIISSAQSPGKFGYKDNSVLGMSPQNAFLNQEELPDGVALGVFSVSKTNAGGSELFVIGGRRVDRDLLGSIDLPPGMRAMFYQNLTPEFSAHSLIGTSTSISQPQTLAPVIQQVQQQGKEISQLVHWSESPADDENVDAIPLRGPDNKILGILLVANTRRPYVELRQRIRVAALLSGSLGMLLAILVSGSVASRVTRPVEDLALAARQVAAGNWDAQVAVSSTDELGELAGSFNRMTRKLTEQREHLLQAERVAAWRELARRLAHELKNPLFPLQLTVENLLRAHEQSPRLFEEMFSESAATLLAEISNLKGIISRFSEFSRMPQPRYQSADVNAIVQDVFRLFQAQFQAKPDALVECKLELANGMEPIACDPELLHRALSNMVLNALDAMPKGGTLVLRTRQGSDKTYIEVADSGVGLTPEECERLFTPYYTNKAHGTGLGLAIVQSVVSDHGGRISVSSQPDQGTTFRVELPANREKLDPANLSSG